MTIWHHMRTLRMTAKAVLCNIWLKNSGCSSVNVKNAFFAIATIYLRKEVQTKLVNSVLKMNGIVTSGVNEAKERKSTESPAGWEVESPCALTLCTLDIQNPITSLCFVPSQTTRACHKPWHFQNTYWPFRLRSLFLPIFSWIQHIWEMIVCSNQILICGWESIKDICNNTLAHQWMPMLNVKL